MSKKTYWGLSVLIVLIIGTVLLFVKDQAEIRQLERETAEVQKQLQQRKVPQGEHPAQGHFHEDGTFHEGAPPDPIQTPSRDYKLTQIQIPEGITDPEVKKAWERVDYIANNIFAFGGVASSRAEELINELMPPPDGFKGEEAHDELEATLDLLSELAQFRDPRAAEVFATYAGEGIVGGEAMADALVEIGVPAVPYLIPYLEPPYDMLVKDPIEAAFALGHIGRRASRGISRCNRIHHHPKVRSACEC